jgi:lipopolysaccharide transport system ATP-binding protein
MAAIVIEDLWKEYRLGIIGHGTLTHDLQSWWARARGKEDPNAKIKPFLAGQEKQVEGDHFWALRGINLEVAEGEVLGIIGKNGAGKSTLLKILSRVTAPTRGNVKVKGRIASLLEVGTGFHPELTGRENVYLNGAILGMSKQEIKQKFDEIVSFSGVSKYLDTPVKRYSSGMRVRLAFAVAAHLEPEILIIDEVLAVGDAEFQEKCLAKMDDVAKQGRTVLFVSHNLAAVNKLCLSGLLLENGCIKKYGPISCIVNEYLSKPTSLRTFDSFIQRKGNGQVRFTNAEIYSSGVEKNGQILTGKQCVIEICMSNRSDSNYSDTVVDLRIDNALGERLIWMSTSMFEGFKIECDKVCFIIDSLPLNEGFYNITLNCRVKNNVSDWIQNAISFNVKNLNAGPSGKIVSTAQACFVVDYLVKNSCQ